MQDGPLFLIFTFQVLAKNNIRLRRGVKKVSYKIKNAFHVSSELNRKSSLLTFQVFYFCLICCYLRLTKTPCLSNIKNPIFAKLFEPQ